MKLSEKIRKAYESGRRKAQAERDLESELKIVRAGINEKGKIIVGEEYSETVLYFARLAQRTKEFIDTNKAPKGLLQKLTYFTGHELELGLKYLKPSYEE